MVRRDGSDMHCIRYHGHIDHGAGETGCIGRPWVEGKLQAGAVELSHLFAGYHDSRLCHAVGLCWDHFRPAFLLPFLCREDVQ